VSAEGVTRVRRRGAVILDNNTVYDTSISYTALGVLAVLLARPDDAPKGYRTLLRPEAGVGQASILSAFRELRSAGYRYQFLRTVTTPTGNKVYTDTYIYEAPVSLEMAKRDHFDTTGQVAIDVPDRRKSKATLASVPDAQDPDAQDPGAHAPAAQTPGGASVGFQALEKTPAQINQREANGTPVENSKAGQVLPSQPTAAAGNAATPKAPLTLTPEQMERNRQGAARARAALRGLQAADAAGAPAGITNEVAPLRIDQRGATA
jgi:hypothetical protein